MRAGDGVGVTCGQMWSGGTSRKSGTATITLPLVWYSDHHITAKKPGSN